MLVALFVVDGYGMITREAAWTFMKYWTVIEEKRLHKILKTLFIIPLSHDSSSMVNLHCSLLDFSYIEYRCRTPLDDLVCFV